MFSRRSVPDPILDGYANLEIETYCYLRMHDCLVWREWGERERKKEGRKEKGFGLLHAYPREDDASGYEHLSQGCDLSVLPSPPW